jgi:hypothetical protein
LATIKEGFAKVSRQTGEAIRFVVFHALTTGWDETRCLFDFDEGFVDLGFLSLFRDFFEIFLWQSPNKSSRSIFF